MPVVRKRKKYIRSGIEIVIHGWREKDGKQMFESWDPWNLHPWKEHLAVDCSEAQPCFIEQ